jgi:hypothetical protein
MESTADFGGAFLSGVRIPAMLADIWQYILDLADHWAAFITGGPIVAILVFWERWRDKTIPFRIYVAIFLVIGFVAAGFLTWRQERDARVQAEQTISVTRNRSATKAELQKFYIELGALLEVQLKQDISPADFENYKAESNRILNEQAQWIKDNMGDAALARFADKSNMKEVRFKKAVNDVHNIMLMNQTRFHENLKDLIESSAWDKN